MNGDKIRSSFSSVVPLCILIGILIVFLLFSFAFSKEYKLNIVNGITNNSDEPLSILIVGDMMLDRNVRNTINSKGFDSYFSGVKDLIQGADISVANLEGAFTDFPSVTASLQSKELQFTFDPALAAKLFDLGFDILGLANNHSFNFGRTGLEMTRRYIGSSGMFYYGDPFNKDEISTIITKKGIKVAFVGFHEFYYTNFDKVFQEVERLKKEVDIVIVSPHWGIEYQKEPTEKMVKWAHEFIDSGADAVIGAHPHIVGTTEEYKGKKIYYSLGNFAFDQYFSKETMEGLAVIMYISKDPLLDSVKIRYENIPIKIGREGITLR